MLNNPGGKILLALKIDLLEDLFVYLLYPCKQSFVIWLTVLVKRIFPFHLGTRYRMIWGRTIHSLTLHCSQLDVRVRWESGVRSLLMPSTTICWGTLPLGRSYTVLTNVSCKLHNFMCDKSSYRVKTVLLFYPEKTRYWWGI